MCVVIWCVCLRVVVFEGGVGLLFVAACVFAGFCSLFDLLGLGLTGCGVGQGCLFV